MSSFMICVKKFLKGEEGYVDTGLMIALIASICVTAIAAMGLHLKKMHETPDEASVRVNP